jgi:subtilisin family serine protease
MTLQPRSLALWAVLFFALGACTPTPQQPVSLLYAPTDVQHFSRVEEVSLSATDTPASVSALHGATVISWHPEDGYAMLGFEISSQALALGAQPPRDYRAPSAEDPKAYGLSSWSSGWNVWSNGWNVWSSGWTVWGGGSGSTMPGQNALVWQRIRLPQAVRLAPKAGEGVIVAVIDTGVDLQHPALQGALTPSNTWWDWVGGDATPQDESGGSSFGHGTCVAGIVLQVAPKAKIMPLRVLAPDGMGATASVIAAIDWAVARGAKIINLSLGTTWDRNLDRAIDSATKRGVFVVASTGNTGDQNVTYPANETTRSGSWGDMSLGVGSSNVSDRKSAFSTWGYGTVEMVAVGEGVSSPAPGRRMATWNGTSMAAPMVSAGLALALGQRSFSDLRRVGREIAADGDSLFFTDPDFGWVVGGRLNLETFLLSVLDSRFK